MIAGLLGSLAFARPEAPRPTPGHVVAWRDAVDWGAARDEVVTTLSEYLAIDTVNPPGHEARGVAWLGAVLDREGIAWSELELSPGRSSLIARIEATGGEPGAGDGLCLVHHIDVVPSETERWSDPLQRGPLSGAVVDGHVWGRGALDMKGMGALELMTLIWLARLEVPLQRDVVLVALADEEVDNLGARQLAERWGEIGCSHVINEGGLGIRDALFDGQSVHAISTAEKGILWVRMHAEGRAGHGSVPHPDEAPSRLLEAMAAVQRHRPRYRLDDDIAQLLRNVGAHRGGLTGRILQTRWLVRTLAWSRLKAEPTMRAALHDTIHLTGVSAQISGSPNVVPSQASATYDCRLLPGTEPDRQLARLKILTRGIEGIHFEVLSQDPSNGSSIDDPLYEAIAHYAVEDRPWAVAGPFLSVGFTDSLLLRPVGAIAYGYVPFELSAEVAGTMHGHDERVPIEQVGEGLRRLLSITLDVAADPASSPR